jgi:hypothetical protein
VPDLTEDDKRALAALLTRAISDDCFSDVAGGLHADG